MDHFKSVLWSVDLERFYSLPLRLVHLPDNVMSVREYIPVTDAMVYVLKSGHIYSTKSHFRILTGHTPYIMLAVITFHYDKVPARTGRPSVGNNVTEWDIAPQDQYHVKQML